MATSTNDDSRRVLSWIENEQRCVTAQRICQELNLSRPVAIQLLDRLLRGDESPDTNTGKSNFQVTKCHKIKESPMTTVFRLRQSTSITPTNEGVESSDESTSIFALAAIEATESVVTAHERDMVEWREMIADGRHHQNDPTSTQNGEIDDITIEAADDIQGIKGQPSHSRTEVPSRARTTNPVPSSANRHKAFVGQAKVTTAASFFAKKPKSAGLSSAASSKLPVSGSKSATSESSASFTKAAAESTEPCARAGPRPTRAKENKLQQSQNTTSKRSTITNTKKKPIGNADDFIADEEESDDEEEVQAKRKELQQQREAAKARRKAVAEANRAQDLDQGDKMEDPVMEKETSVRGAMDAFATTRSTREDDATNHKSTRQRKRRKKMVEKTTMVNGYLRTETQAVWEDIPTDEEEEEKQAAIAKKKSTATSNRNTGAVKKTPKGVSTAGAMKQKSLMGFFAAKK